MKEFAMGKLGLGEGHLDFDSFPITKKNVNEASLKLGLKIQTLHKQFRYMQNFNKLMQRRVDE